MKILISNSYASFSAAELSGTRTIELVPAPPKEGGFGAVYRVFTVDGRPTRPLVVKLLQNNNSKTAAQRGLETIRELQKRASKADMEERAAGRPALVEQWPALCALPLLSFEGTMQGKQVRGYLSADLTALGFKDFAEVLDDQNEVAALQTLPIANRLAIVKQLIDCFEFLSSRLQFIHADIKADALFINKAAASCALIDFDSGALARDAFDKPTTFGTRQDWLAPEISKQLLEQPTGSGDIQVDILSDSWSVNIAIHYLLFGCHPLFFLSEVSERSMAAYCSQFIWPNVDPAFPYFRADYAPTYHQYMQALAATVPQEIIRSLRSTLKEGFADPTRRCSYSQWQSAFRRLMQPGIQFFKSDCSVATNGRPVKLSWDVFGARSVQLTSMGDVTDRSSISLPVREDSQFILRAVAWSGQIIEQTLGVTVDKTPPVIDQFHADTALVTSRRPVRLAWSVTGAEKAAINGIDVTGRNHYEIPIRSTTVFCLNVESYYGIASSAQITVPVSSTPPDIHYFWADRNPLKDDDTVTLQWDVSATAEAVELSGVGKVPYVGSITLSPANDITYVLKTTSYFGAIAEKHIFIKVSRKVPSIRRFAVSSLFVSGAAQIRLDWEVVGAVSVVIQPKIGRVSPSGSIMVDSTGVPEFELKAESKFGLLSTRRLVIRSAHAYKRTPGKYTPTPSKGRPLKRLSRRHDPLGGLSRE